MGSNNSTSKSEPIDKIIAQVGSKRILRASDISNIWTNGKSADSAAIVSAYIQQWIRNSTVLDEAERTLSPTLDIKKKVADYEASLLLHYYREEVVRRKLDTSITKIQLEKTYEINKSNFQLAEDLVQCRVAKIKANARGLERFYKNWKSNKLGKISSYCKKHECLLNDNDWVPASNISLLLPEKKFNIHKVISRKYTQRNYKGYEYFVKILDRKPKGDTPPLPYIEDKLREIIIHERKKALLDKIESDIYNRDLESNKIKVFK